MGTTTEEDPPGVVVRAQTSTELLEVWAPVQFPILCSVGRQLDKAVAEIGNNNSTKVMERIAAEIFSRNFCQSMCHSQLF
jgi:hypothetical protein